MFRAANTGVKVEEILESSEESKTSKYVTINQIVADIKKRLYPILDAYLDERSENPKQFNNIFNAGISLADKKLAVDAFKFLLDGKFNQLTDMNIKALRNGDLGKALRAEIKNLAKDIDNSKTASIRGMIAYLQYHHFQQGPFAAKLNII